MNILSGLSGFVSGVVVSAPTMFLGGVTGQKIGQYLKVTKDVEVAASGMGGVAFGLVGIALLGSSPFYTGVKVAIAASSIIYISYMAMAAVTVNVEKRNATIMGTKSFLAKSIMSAVAGAVTGSVVAVFGSAIFNPVVGCFLGSFTAYTITGIGTVYAALKNGVTA